MHPPDSPLLPSCLLLTLCAVRTAEEASDSRGDMGTGVCLRMFCEGKESETGPSVGQEERMGGWTPGPNSHLEHGVVVERRLSLTADLDHDLR